MPESLIEAVRKAGHRADLIVVRHWHLTALCIEMDVGNNLSRVLIDISEDFERGTDIATSEWEVVQELVEPPEAATVRRLVQVRAWSHADAMAVETLVDTLCSLMGGRLPARQTW